MLSSASPRVIEPTATGLRPALVLVPCLIALSLAPVCLTDIPALIDYPNHLARMSILARAGTAAANPFYEPAWAFYPNLAMDLLVPPLGRLIGVVAATKLFYLCSQLLLIGGAMALSWTVRRAAIGAAVTACLCLYSVPFAWGFVNFEFGLGLSLWGIAAWIRLAHAPAAARIAAHAGIVLTLYVSHLFGLGVYGFTVGVFELWRARAERRGPFALAGTLAQMAAPVVVLVVASVALGGFDGDFGGEGRTRWDFGLKLLWPYGINGALPPVSFGLTLCLVLLAGLAVRLRAVRLVGAGAWLVTAFAALYLVMPIDLRDVSLVDLRVLVAAALVLPAFIKVDIREPAWRKAAIALLAGVAVVNLAAAAYVQVSHAPAIHAMIASFDRLAPRSRILVAHASQDGPDALESLTGTLSHVPTLAAHYADAFVPTLFAIKGQQPIRPVSPRLEIAGPADKTVNTAMLARIVAGRPPKAAPAFIGDWTHDYDYVYVLGAGTGNPFPRLLEPVVQGAEFALFRVRTPEP